MLDVMLVNSPLFKENNQSYKDEYLPPIGLGYIASTLFKANIDVVILDAVAEGLSIDEIIKEINQLQPKFVGFNIFTTNYELVKEIVENIYLTTTILIGGISTKALYKRIFLWETNNKLNVIYGDGEKITLDIVKQNITEEPYEFFENKNFYLVSEISKYYIKDISELTLNRDFFEFEPIKNVFNEFEVSIVTSRGCIYNCAYCSAASSRNKEMSIRERDKKSIEKELTYVKNRYPQVKSIRILDDLFLKNLNSIKNAIEIFNKFNFQWRGMAHINSFKNINQDYLKQLKNSGCLEFSIGIESGSENILKFINKNTKIDIIKNTVENILKGKISVKAYFILGFPTETLDDFISTYELAKCLKELSKKYGNTEFRISIFKFRPYEGTKLYDLIVKENTNLVIEHDNNLTDVINRGNFNFSAGNYSECENSELNSFIEKIHKLNDI